MSYSYGKRVAIYSRISKDRYEDQSGVTRQKADCERYVADLKADGRIPAGAEVQH